jgi:hypothetical protein
MAFLAGKLSDFERRADLADQMALFDEETVRFLKKSGFSRLNGVFWQGNCPISEEERI